MQKLNLIKTSMAVTVLFVIGSCNKNAPNSAITQAGTPKSETTEMISESGTNPDEASITENLSNTISMLNSGVRSAKDAGHFLYTESNSSDGNTILSYQIKQNGTLQRNGSTASGGIGTGSGLGSQGALVIDNSHHWLFAVNAGSNSVSSFKINEDGSLTLSHTVASGGNTPNSVTVSGNLLYVLNHGSDAIHGFKIETGGTLIDIAGSTQSLSSTRVDAPEISFTPDGRLIVVTEKATNKITTFKIKNDGSVGEGIFTSSVGQTPFGFDFSRDQFMIVSNAVGGAMEAGSASSYIIGNKEIPVPINGAVPDLQTAPCWFATTKYGRFAYTTNAHANTISSYYVAPWGSLYLIKSIAATTGLSPLDIKVAANNYYIYELNAASKTIGEYYRKFLGELGYIGSVSGLPASATGLATY